MKETVLDTAYERWTQCNRVEKDEALNFCRVDGATLINDSVSFLSEGATAQLGSQPDTGEVHTSIQTDCFSTN